MNLNDDLQTIKGIGEKTAAAFAKLHIHTVNELLHTYPRSYLTYEDPIMIGEAQEGERVSVLAVINTYVDVRKVRGMTLSNIGIRDSSGTMKVTWFNQPFLKNVLAKGDSYVFVGTVKLRNGSKCLDHPEYYKLEKYREMTTELMPVYPLTKGLTNNTFVKAVKATRGMISQIEDYIPEEIRQSEKLMELSEAYENVHFPQNETLLVSAIRRIAFDEFYSFLYDLNKLKNKNITIENTHKVVQGSAVNDLVNSLPYKLTKGQWEAIEDILADMGGDSVMNRLVQGDVGAGKTVVAEAALLAVVKAGYQGALMVPTEVLAKQHFTELTKMFDAFGIRVALLVGSTPAKEKRGIYERLKNGEIDVLVGTHALIEDKVEFADLALVITDEQHRFGVSQRERLRSKGTYPHVLVMSATPIPRTLAIILYADLDISVIAELPKGRKPIKNCAVGTNYRETAYKFLATQVSEGSQCYVICPMVQESETMDLTNVVQYTERLRSVLPPNCKVEMLHGQMKAEEKNAIMERFLAGEIDVLVSTTVIEVGINNQNATVMMVENAERFGLAQLHQLRGRVGRGKKQSYCIFINGKPTKESMDRLKVLEDSNDGFYIANEDLKMRGPGDFFGIRQSGEAIFVMADIYNHADMLKLAQTILLKYGDTLEPPALVHKVQSQGTVL